MSVDRLFLDANILFSVAHRERAGVAALWSLADIELISSNYAIDEAVRNLSTDDQRGRLAEHTGRMQIIDSISTLTFLSQTIDLPEKDWPILIGAIDAKATHLITGDKDHFGKYFDTTIAGVLIMPPSEYLKRRSGDG